MDEKLPEIMADNTILRLENEALHDRCVELEKNKRIAIGQKIKYRDQLENLVWYLYDHTDGVGNGEYNLNTLKEEFDFVKNILEVNNG